MEKRHILICGRRRSGKSTLIERLAKELKGPVGGFRTRMFDENDKGFFPIHIYAPGDMSLERRAENHIGDCNGREREINISTFDLRGVELLSGAERLLIMDELGFMETGSPGFCSKVLEHLDGDGHVLAAVKSDMDTDFLIKVRSHPKAELYMISEENRDELYEKLLPIIRSWNEK